MKEDEMLAEYDFSVGVRGKFVGVYAEGTNVVLLDEDVAKAFPDAVSVNQALRLLIRLAKEEATPHG